MPAPRRHLALYSRVSGRGQSVDPQLHLLHEYAERRGGPAVDYTDHAQSGAKARRPALDRLLAAVRRREVEALVCVKLDRLARSVRHLTELAAELEVSGTALVVLDQSIDTATPAGRFLFNTLGAVAELERDLIRERTLAGLAVARRRGKRFGRPPAVYPPQLLARVRRLRQAGHSFRRIAELLEVSVGQAHKLARVAAA